jgi:peptidoglycan/LPS O-acetylase OafA/YrhL
MASKQVHYFGVFDALRGIAALVVAVYHVEWLHIAYDWSLIRHADYMVDFFFVLSGFVICHVYGRRINDGESARRFMTLRLFRLYPLHLFLLAVFLLIEIIKYIAVTQYGLVANHPPFAEGWPGLLAANALMVHAVGILDRLAFNVPSWSISTEFFAYLAFTAVFFGRGRSRSRIAWSVLIMAGAVIVLLMFNHASLIGNTVRFGLVRCLAGFFAGVLTYEVLCVIQHSKTSRRQALALDAIAVALLAVAAWMVIYAWGRPWEFAILPVYCGLLLAVGANENGLVGRLMNRAPLIWLGTRAYSIYMVHLAVLWLFSQYLRFVLGVSLENNIYGTQTYQTGPVAGSFLLLAYLVVVLWVSHFTYVHIEDRFRRVSKARLAAKEGRQ